MTDDSATPRHGARETVRGRVQYGLSLPERALRSAAGVVGGTLRDSASMLLPDAVRGAKTYQASVGQMLDFLAEEVGRVGGTSDRAEEGTEAFVARKTVGNFIDVASLATVHLSPMLLLAVVSDVAHGSQAYLREFADELQRQGVVRDAARIQDVDDLLEEVGAASATAASAFDLPPLTVAGLRETVAHVRESVAGVDAGKVITKAEVAALWEAMRATAKRDGVSAFRVSGAMTLGVLGKRAAAGGSKYAGTGGASRLGDGALSSARAVSVLLDRHVLDHYRAVLADIDEAGFYPTLAAVGRPYLEAAAANFAPERETLTEKALASVEGAVVAKVRRLLRRR